ncbi:hypothetical protein ABTM19_20360, partial [Acinetobacter baumannii]
TRLVVLAISVVTPINQGRQPVLFNSEFVIVSSLIALQYKNPLLILICPSKQGIWGGHVAKT